MKILFVTIAWPHNGSNIYTDLLKELNNRGHEISVLCNIERRFNKEDSFQNENGFYVARLKSGNITKTGIFEKGVSLLLLGSIFKKGFKRYFVDKTYDLILFNTPPITLSIFLNFLKKTCKCPVYLLLKDIWPQGSVDLGVINRYSPLWIYYRWHERKLYKISDFIGCMSPANVEYLLKWNKYLCKDKIEVCPNCIIPTNNNKPTIDPTIKSRLGIPKDAIVFLFSGNLGLGHGLGFYYEAILKLQNYKKSFFLIGGAGTQYKYLENRVKEDKPTNLLLYSWLPENDFKQVLLLSDIGVILLSKLYSTPQFPSRLLAYLDNSMPVFCVINKATDIGDIVSKYNAGLSIQHGDQVDFISSVKEFCTMSESQRIRMGNNANNLLKAEYSASISANNILSHF